MKIKNLLGKKVTILGKGIPVFALALLVLGATGVTAALLDYYGLITGQAQVEQSLIVELGETNCLSGTCVYDIGDSPAYAGSTYLEQIKLTNRANRQVPIDFVTTVMECDGPTTEGCQYTSCDVDASAVISTRYLGELVLENKERTGWAAITGDDIQATLTYDLVSPTFDYELEATGLQADTNYVLIYYADRQDRFVNWGGDNPGRLIRTVMTDENGYILTTGNTELNTDLPHTDDWNLDADPNYCGNANGFDNYSLCSGAKLWLVPLTEYNTGTKAVTWANPDSYLYETDMIDYSDSTTDETFNMNTGFIDVNIENTFDLATEAGCYQIITEVEPST